MLISILLLSNLVNMVNAQGIPPIIASNNIFYLISNPTNQALLTCNDLKKTASSNNIFLHVMAWNGTSPTLYYYTRNLISTPFLSSGLDNLPQGINSMDVAIASTVNYTSPEVILVYSTNSAIYLKRYPYSGGVLNTSIPAQIIQNLVPNGNVSKVAIDVDEGGNWVVVSCNNLGEMFYYKGNSGSITISGPHSAGVGFNCDVSLASSYNGANYVPTNINIAYSTGISTGLTRVKTYNYVTNTLNGSTNISNYSIDRISIASPNKINVNQNQFIVQYTVPSPSGFYDVRNSIFNNGVVTDFSLTQNARPPFPPHLNFLTRSYGLSYTKNLNLYVSGFGSPQITNNTILGLRLLNNGTLFLPPPIPSYYAITNGSANNFGALSLSGKNMNDAYGEVFLNHTTNSLIVKVVPLTSSTMKTEIGYQEVSIISNKKSVEIFPNPCSSFIRLNLEGFENEDIELTIIGSDGLAKLKINGDKQKVISDFGYEFPKLISGLYFVFLKSGHYQEITSILKN